MQAKKQQLELDMEQLTDSKLRKEHDKAVYWHLSYLTFMQSTSCEIWGWVNQAGLSQPWIFTRRTDTEAEAPRLWPPDAKSWLTGKDPDAEKEWRQKEKGVAEDEIVR